MAAGGLASAAHLFLLGAPRAALLALIGRSLSARDRQAVNDESQTPHWAWLSSRDATDADLQGESWWLLTLMRNEIYARHGRPFSDPLLRKCFQERGCYRVNPTYNDGQFSARERRNAQFIIDYQGRNNRLGL